MDYNKLLKKARKELPDSVLKTERFVIPKIRGHLQGNKTVLSNFFQIVDLFNRDADHVLKYLHKELATPGEVNKNLVILGRKVSAGTINKKIKEYAKKYLICKECEKPDTSLTKKQRLTFIKCKACGAKYTVN